MDLFLRVRRTHDEHRLLHSALRSGGARLAPMADLIGAWVDGGGIFSTARHIWLEYDADSHLPPGAPSIVFWHLRSEDGSIERDGEAQATILRQASQRLNTAPPPHALDLLRGVVDALPDRGEVFCVGSTERQGVSTVRLCLHRLDIVDVPDFLETIQHPGRAHLPLETLTALQEAGVEVKVDLDLDHAIGERLHLELRPASQEGWQALTAQLAGWDQRGVFQPLLAWPESGMCTTDSRIFVPLLSHIKMVVDPSTSAHLKAYLGLWECARISG